LTKKEKLNEVKDFENNVLSSELSFQNQKTNNKNIQKLVEYNPSKLDVSKWTETAEITLNSQQPVMNVSRNGVRNLQQNFLDVNKPTFHVGVLNNQAISQNKNEKYVNKSTRNSFILNQNAAHSANYNDFIAATDL